MQGQELLSSGVYTLEKDCMHMCFLSNTLTEFSRQFKQPLQSTLITIQTSSL